MVFYNCQKLGVVSAIFIAFFCLSISAFFSQNAEAVCDDLREKKDHAASHLSDAEYGHAITSGLLWNATLRRGLNETIHGKKEPSDATITELTALNAAAYYILTLAQSAYDDAQTNYSNCLRLHRHSCGCPSTNQNVSSCSCSWQSYRYGVNCPCYDS